MNSFKEYLAGSLEPVRGLIVANFVSAQVEYFKVEAGLQRVLGMGQ